MGHVVTASHNRRLMMEWKAQTDCLDVSTAKTDLTTHLIFLFIYSIFRCDDNRKAHTFAKRMTCMRCLGRYRRILKNPIEYIETRPLDTNILEWHFVMTGNQDPYTGGISGWHWKNSHSLIHGRCHHSPSFRWFFGAKKPIRHFHLTGCDSLFKANITVPGRSR